MPDQKLPTLSDLPSAASAPVYPPLSSLENITPALDEISPPPTAEPLGYWVRIIDRKLGTRSKVNCTRVHNLVTFKNGEAVVPANLMVEHEGGLEGQRPRSRVLDILRDEFGYECVPIPPGTPLVPSDDVATWQRSLAASA